MNQFGIHYAYWGNEWKVDMCERIRLAADAGFDDLEVYDQSGKGQDE